MPQNIYLRYKDLINWDEPTDDDLKKAFDKMSEDEFHAYRKWYISKKMNIKGSDWIVDVDIWADKAFTEILPFDEAEKIITVNALRSFDNSSQAKIETVGKFIVKVNDPTNYVRPPQ